MKWNLNKNISLGFCIVFIVLNATGIFSYYSLHSFRDVRRNEVKARKSQVLLENIQFYIRDIETGQQGYVISGDSTYLESYNHARLLITEEIASFSKNYKNQKRLKELDDLVDRKVKLAEQTIRLKNEKGQKDAIAVLRSGTSRDLLAQLQSLIVKIKTEEIDRYDLQSDEVDSKSGYALIFIIIGNVIALSFLAWVLILLNSDIGKRIRTEIVLNRFIVKAEQAKKREEQFLANMSHEIRTPMNAIIGMTNLILNTPLAPKQESYLKAIRQSSDNLMVIINEILDFSKINAGKIEFEKINFNLSDIFYGLYNTFKIKTDEKEIKLTPIIDESLPDTIIGDPGKLNQVLVNLVGNSVKFTEKGSIDMYCRLIEQKGNDLLIEFSVQDTGIGIPQNKLATIFEDFAQAARDTSRKFGGTGLGLSISKKIVELQGGTITVESKLGEGTTFSFRIWYKAGTEKVERNEKPIQTRVQELHGIKILLVEDNEFNQVVAVDTLKSLIKNLTIDVASNGKVAIELLKNKSKHYDIILMDVQMPEMNGYETTKYIRKNSSLGYSDVPVIAMTASATKPEIDSCFDSGMTDFISKPFDADILLIKISTLINKEKVIELTKDNKEVSGSLMSEGMADLSFLRGMTSNNRDQMLKYINMFLESVPGDWQKLKEKAAENNWKEVGLIAHALKPRVKYMGIKVGSDIVQQIEHQSVEQVDLEIMQELIAKFDSILYLTYQQLETEKQTLY
ncbi:MAG: response regulator [Sporocytophaga sp.]|uniref:ATP-binding protein n=1 Tax=Sporocytophaga sp. TaxID=2231183 RepID=UPI001B20584D|nr:ATP-binding protein [Sporocytophaga sp.]MBO9703424.1 response regulator [Sporocytophaga sp.]